MIINNNILKIKYNDNLISLITNILAHKNIISNEKIMKICGEFYITCCLNKNSRNAPSLEIYNNYNGEKNYNPTKKITVITLKEHIHPDIDKYLKKYNLSNSPKNFRHYGYDSKNNIFYTEKCFYLFYDLFFNDIKNNKIEQYKKFIDIIVVYYSEENNSFYVSKAPTINEIFNLGCYLNGIIEEKFSINGINVPKWLYCKKPEELTVDDYIILKNADVKAEFLKKAGIDKLICLGDLVDSYENYPDNEWWIKSEYKLIDMRKVLPPRKFIYTLDNDVKYIHWDYAPFLYMKNQTTGIYHLEGVNPKCKNLYDALKMRYKTINLPKFQIEDIK